MMWALCNSCDDFSKKYQNSSCGGVKKGLHLLNKLVFHQVRSLILVFWHLKSDTESFGRCFNFNNILQTLSILMVLTILEA
jgi:hypothetical protein